MADFIANVVLFQYLRNDILSSGFSLEIFPPSQDFPVSFPYSGPGAIITTQISISRKKRSKIVSRPKTVGHASTGQMLVGRQAVATKISKLFGQMAGFMNQVSSIRRLKPDFQIDGLPPVTTGSPSGSENEAERFQRFYSGTQ
ncbi:MAG: hypothetical protein JRJ09_17710 [Deltaproteobacteria bacterium]|nr:hypothetical protein [Deltaproteobacteria bacterium]